MSLEIYPETPTPEFSFSYSDEYLTIESDYEGDNEQRQSLVRFPKRNFILTYKTLAISSEWPTIHNFFTKNRGAWNPFWFFFPQLRNYTDEYVGRGDGATTAFDLHSKSTDYSSLKVYINEILKTIGIHYNFVSGGGEGGSDRIVFTAGNIPALGALIKSDFKGQLRIKGKFKDKFSGKWFSPSYDEIEAIEIKEIHW